MGKGLQLAGGLGLLLLYFLATLGCEPTLNQPVGPPSNDISTEQTAAVSPSDSIVVGSFNIQVFGRAKMSNPDVTAILVDITRRFDILAIQELRSTEQNIIPNFVAMINANGSKYEYIVGPRQGHTSSKEQYVYIYDSEKIELISQPYIAPVLAGEIHRSPLVARFRCKNVVPENAFTFKLINIHTDPDEVRTELPTLASIIDGIEQYDPGEDDLILLGDLNAPPRYFNSFPLFDNQYAAIADSWQTKTKQNLNRDNIVFDAGHTQEFLSRSGVFNIMQEYGLSVENALLVSDHLPVWAVFSTTEAYNPSLAAQRGEAIR